MLAPSKLKDRLVASGLTLAEYDRAIAYAMKQRVGLDQALISEKLMDYGQIGECLGGMYNLPYIPLLVAAPSNRAANLFSPKFAYAWMVFPLAYDSDNNMLTLAVCDPSKANVVARVHRFLMQHHKLAFTVASEAEIRQAFKLHYNMPPEVETAAAAKGETRKKAISRPTRAAAAGAPPESNGVKKRASALARGVPRRSIAVSIRAEPVKKEDAEEDRRGPVGPLDMERAHTDKKTALEGPGYVETTGALISAIALIVRKFFKDDKKSTQGIQTRVRYAKLLSARLDLSALEIDRTVIAAWLSTFYEERPSVLKQIAVAPYKTEEILGAEGPIEKRRVEAQIIDLVMCYEGFKVQNGAACSDVNELRRHLRHIWSASPDLERMLEAFLQVLMDEEFLTSMATSFGSVLIVDPTEAATSEIATPLTADGYEVKVLMDAMSAHESISESPPDLIISEMDLPDVSGVRFCQAIKSNVATARIPFIMMSARPGEKHAAVCLRAGADEFLPKPVDLELLFLRIQKLVAPRVGDDHKGGVSGTLSDMSFTDMIQILCAGGKNMKVTLDNGKEQAELYIDTGEIVHVQLGDLAGEKAFYELMRWQDGEFSTQQCSEFPERTVRSSAMSLLMEGARIADEMGA